MLLLAGDRPDLLRGLAASPLSSAQARSATLRAAAPAPAVRDKVTSWLTAHGLRVDHVSPWSISATAPDATAAAAMFGSRLVPDGDQLTHVGALRVPSALAGSVTSVVGLDDRAVFRPSVVRRPGGTLGSTELRSAYNASTGDGTGTTVATIEFSGWSPSDLRNYALGSGLNPIIPVQLTTPSRASAQRLPSDADGDFEVALDQQAILAAAPGAEQRMYFTGNSLSGFVEALDAIESDVTVGVPISALSVSWGVCDADLRTKNADDLAAVESKLFDVVNLAGVTVFAAAGDYGAYDCQLSGGPSATTRSQDFPASFPSVVAVGGTKLTGKPGAWDESAWGPTFAAAGTYTAGGGGFSPSYDRPIWQLGIGAQFPAGSRGVPDIASAADPSAGLAVYNARLCRTTGWCMGGGTSASAPTQAALFAAALASNNRVGGIGDIHGVLYGHPQSFRDITSGSNGTYSAGLGWDPATGLGAPDWSSLSRFLLSPALITPAASATAEVPIALALPAGTVGLAYAAGVTGSGDETCDAASLSDAPGSVAVEPADGVVSVSASVVTDGGNCLTATSPVIVDSTPPTANARLVSVGKGRVTVAWAADDGPVPSGAGKFDLVLRAADGNAFWTASRAMPGAQTVNVPAGTYRLEVQATDRAGNLGDWAISRPVTIAKG